MLPCLIFEDDHLLVVNKPPGLNTHAPSPYAGEGLYDWLRHRETRWAGLAIIHRLDKDTSGLIVFSKSPLANRRLTEQFTARAVRKKYLLLTDGPAPPPGLVVASRLVRAGDRYVSRPLRDNSDRAETRFQPFTAPPGAGEARHTGRGLTWVEAEPLTGRTHQIRVHAAEKGFPILGDTLYGGTPASRVCLHAAELALSHPASGEPIALRAPVDFSADPRQELRRSLIDPEETTAYRLLHGASDGSPGWYVDRLGDFLLSQSEQSLTETQMAELEEWGRASSCLGACHKVLSRSVRGASLSAASPRPVSGAPAPDRFVVRENGLRFELSVRGGYSVGLFLDQRDNRRRLLTGQLGRGRLEPGPGPCPTLLNTFAYTCGFSVAAARAGFRTTSLDLSRKYLDWGRRNFELNQVDPARHDFIFGDAFDWLRRLGKQGRQFDVVLLDPPTFSTSRQSGVFRAEKDYPGLIAAALPVLRPNGVLFASTNAAAWPPEDFLAAVQSALRRARRPVLEQTYFPQPPDFPVTRAEPAYLKTVWLRVG